MNCLRSGFDCFLKQTMNYWQRVPSNMNQIMFTSMRVQFCIEILLSGGSVPIALTGAGLIGLAVVIHALITPILRSFIDGRSHFTVAEEVFRISLAIACVEYLAVTFILPRHAMFNAAYKIILMGIFTVFKKDWRDAQQTHVMLF